MAVLFTDPIDWISQFQQALDNFRTSGWLGSSPSGSGGYPPLNVFRKGDGGPTELPSGATPEGGSR